MQTIATHTQEGAYGYDYTVRIEKGRTHHYGVVRGFRWNGNEGGMNEERGRLSEADAAAAASLIEAAANGRGILADAGLYVLERLVK